MDDEERVRGGERRGRRRESRGGTGSEFAPPLQERAAKGASAASHLVFFLSFVAVDILHRGTRRGDLVLEGHRGREGRRSLSSSAFVSSLPRARGRGSRDDSNAVGRDDDTAPSSTSPPSSSRQRPEGPGLCPGRRAQQPHGGEAQRDGQGGLAEVGA